MGQKEIFSCIDDDGPEEDVITIRPKLVLIAGLIITLMVGNIGYLVTGFPGISRSGPVTDVPKVSLWVHGDETLVLINSGHIPPSDERFTQAPRVHFDYSLGTAILPITATEVTSASPGQIFRLTTSATADFARHIPKSTSLTLAQS